MIVERDGNSYCIAKGYEHMTVDFDKLCEEVKKYVEVGKKAEEDLVWSKWYIGQAIGHRAYGDQVVDKLSDALSIDRSELYRCIKFSKLYPSIESVNDLMLRARNWNQVRKSLPDPLESKSSDGEKKESVLGIDTWSRVRLESYIDSGVPADHIDEVVSHLTNAVETDFDLLRKVDPTARVGIPEVADVALDITSPEKLTPGQWRTHQAMVRLYPCVICGTEDSTFHHWPYTKGSGGKDWRGIPLCPKCHGDVQELGIEESMTLFGIDALHWLMDSLCVFHLKDIGE